MNDSTSPSERDFKPGDRVRHLNISGDLEIVAVVDGRAWVRNPENHSEDWVLMVDGDFLPAPAHPIPSEPGHYEDESGRHWLHQVYKGSAYGAPERDTDQWIDPNGEIADPSGHELTRLVTEGSEREAAIREVVEYLHSQGSVTYSLAVAGRFLSGVDQ